MNGIIKIGSGGVLTLGFFFLSERKQVSLKHCNGPGI